MAPLHSLLLRWLSNTWELRNFSRWYIWVFEGSQLEVKIAGGKITELTIGKDRLPSNHHFSGAKMLNFGVVNVTNPTIGDKVRSTLFESPARCDPTIPLKTNISCQKRQKTATTAPAPRNVFFWRVNKKRGLLLSLRRCVLVYTPRKFFNIFAPETWWLEDYFYFPFGFLVIFQGANMLNFQEG